jgi:hypothetical protein
MSLPIIKREHVQVSAAPAQAPLSVAKLLQGEGGELCAGEKGVRLLHEGEDVRAIEFTCACGDVTVVELQYPTGTQS